MRPKGSAEALEVRRRIAARLLQEGKGVQEVALSPLHSHPTPGVPGEVVFINQFGKRLACILDIHCRLKDFGQVLQAQLLVRQHDLESVHRNERW